MRSVLFQCILICCISLLVTFGWKFVQFNTSRLPPFWDNSTILISGEQIISSVSPTTNVPTEIEPTNDAIFGSCQKYESSIIEKLKNEVEEVKQCVKSTNGDKKCFKFKGEEVYAKEKYKEEDMVMKYPHQYNVILNNPNACENDPHIVIGSPVGPRQLEERIATRRSWGRVKEVNGMRVKHIFFAGQDENDPEGDKLLQEENNCYHDIIQFDMKNHFMNLTLLSILTYNWTSHYCPNIKYYVRCDNDMWMNPELLISNMLSTPRNNSILGFLIPHGQPIRHPLSRYYLPSSVYPESYFPPYMSGCFVAISGDALRGIVETSSTIRPILYFDDVYLGLVARQRGISLIPVPPYKVFFGPIPFNSFFKQVWGIHRIGPSIRVALWELTMK